MNTNINDIIAMGGYGAYVWPAFGATFVILITLYCLSRARLKKALRQADKTNTTS